ncbi:helix-hairpin-helix domain-containing protein [Aceticella autotrophica]|uniref:Helix-hairpin-helix domain-containing protein n=1 Tax=Aceticella autotrophica TaxID=2755338 RepID=A0A975AUT5_9THEO|nr:helix-hairpin-helix domain-containing protein [Aceticella autotrophica]QSZ26838.1 helix-hairpin-helix domain-containing protein [Aceticella autotrophica]
MFNFSKKQQYAVIILICIALCISGYFIVERSKNQQDIKVQTATAKSSVSNNSKGNNETIKNFDSKKELKVYITGLVKSPGVYIMREGDRIDDAIKLAGGVIEGADLSNMNLAEKVKDEQMIKVTKIGENPGNQSSNTGNSSVNIAGNNGKININTASKEQLDSLPGIGAVTAQKIIDFREQHGKFQKIDDIMNVPRIGQKLFEQIKDKITVD